MTSEPALAVPHPALRSRNPLRWLRFIGPGAVVASVTIGSGELVFSSRGGALFGYDVLWVLLAATAMKWTLAYCSLRHMVLSGAHPFDRWSHLPGPAGWFPIFFLSMSVPFFPVWLSFLAGTLGTACTWIVGTGELYGWGTAGILLAACLLAFGYGPLERIQRGILGLMVSCIVVAAFATGPDLSALAHGLFLPQPLQYPDWAVESLPHLRSRSEWLEVLVAASAIGGTSYNYLSYATLSRDKGWGRSPCGPATAQQLSQIEAEPQHGARVWLRAALADSLTSFALLIVLAGSFCILGSEILAPRHLVPDGTDLLNYQASFLGSLSAWLLPVYITGVLLAFFGTLYGGPELQFQLVHQYLTSAQIDPPRVSPERLRQVVIVYSLGGALCILWGSRLFPQVQLIDIVTPAAIFTGMISCGLYCLANPWTDYRFLPPGLRMPRSLVLMNIIAGVLFTAAGLKTLWDYGQYRAYLVVLAFALASLLLASYRQRRASRDPVGD